MSEFRESLITAAPNFTKTGANTTEATAYTFPLTGGLLGDRNKIIMTAICKVTFNTDTGVLTVRRKYGSTVVAANTFSVVSTPVTDKGLVLESDLSALGGANLQRMTLIGTIELPIVEWGGTPSGQGGGAELSGGNLDDVLSFQWNEVDAAHSVTLEHISYERLSFTEEAAIPEPADLVTAMFTLTPVNRIDRTAHPFWSHVVFYAALEGELDCAGIEPTVFTRAGASTATWRDTHAHAVAANEPKFDWSADAPLGLYLDPGGTGDTIQFAAANKLDTLLTLFWIQDNVVKNNVDDGGSPFNSSGVWAGANAVHVKRVLGFDQLLSQTERAYVKSILPL